MVLDWQLVFALVADLKVLCWHGLQVHPLLVPEQLPSRKTPAPHTLLEQRAHVPFLVFVASLRYRNTPGIGCAQLGCVLHA